ncbi:hypothetical protein [Anoxybacteroides tepidamans]|uniref:hypothetical protein n=1 Tax=Anoxybacteroides tepidamans TaxID=265948 RepID=UPI000A4E38A9|nr:hypothetical protein [Anoxybacillus tepidamans]
MKWLNIVFILTVGAVLAYKFSTGQKVSNSALAIAIFFMTTNFIGLFRKHKVDEQ